ncbi:hypothetical protein BGY98DRAFT_958835 [Russula aff. rugulosa BPL654]|nr:hypothetical protein BGY98DRAFT_958835 [Russula aff. rugulosa BPL654]
MRVVDLERDVVHKTGVRAPVSCHSARVRITTCQRRTSCLFNISLSGPSNSPPRTTSQRCRSRYGSRSTARSIASACYDSSRRRMSVCVKPQTSCTYPYGPYHVQFFLFSQVGDLTGNPKRVQPWFGSLRAWHSQDGWRGQVMGMHWQAQTAT